MARAGKYYVHVIGDDPPILYDNGGRGYTLRNSKAFARIGSQRRKDGSWGEDRVVTRGPRGPVIRVYHHGERLWPMYRSQLKALKGHQALTAYEVPKKLLKE